jgi:hypothetical protein
LFEKADVPLGRIIGSALLFIFAFAATTVAWTPIRKLTGWLLLPFGKHALEAYAVHIFIVALTTKFVFGMLGEAAAHPFVVAVVQIGGVMVVWGIILLLPRLRSLARVFTAGGKDSATEQGGAA